MKAKPGDYVEVISEKEPLKGILMPSSLDDVFILKLDSGYNLGINADKVKSLKVLKSADGAKKKPFAVKQKKGLAKISVLHTGGTIESKVDYRTGGVSADFRADETIAMYPELAEIANIKARSIARMQSEMIRFAHYNIMAREIEKEIKEGCEGIIITHGTDTMHYTSAALAFMLDRIPVPIILVGSQRSYDRGSSDAAQNLASAAFFIANSDFSGVAICMHENLDDESCLVLPALKSRKMHTSRRDAFRPVNANAVARVDYRAKKISFVSENYARKGSERKLSVSEFNEKIKVGVLKVHTNMFAEEILCYKGFDGLVIEGTGLGHMPIQEVDGHTKENRRVFDALKEIIKKGVVVFMSSQAVYGRVQMNVYTPLREIRQAGVLGHLCDMTPETAFVKLAWLLGNKSKAEAMELMEKNLKGEISCRSMPKDFLC